MRLKFIKFKSYKPYNFSTVLNGQKVRVHLRYNAYLDSYYINIDKYINGKYIEIIASVPLSTGIDLMLQHRQLNLGYLYVVPITRELYAENPSATTVQNFMLFWVSNT